MKNLFNDINGLKMLFTEEQHFKNDCIALQKPESHEFNIFKNHPTSQRYALNN